MQRPVNIGGKNLIISYSGKTDAEPELAIEKHVFERRDPAVRESRSSFPLFFRSFDQKDSLSYGFFSCIFDFMRYIYQYFQYEHLRNRRRSYNGLQKHSLRSLQPA